MKNEEKEPIKWIEEKTWDDFRKTGLFMFINTILHAFGWSICVVVDYDKDADREISPVKRAYPARVRFRGFSEQDQDEMHKKIGDYLAENSQDLKSDTLL